MLDGYKVTKYVNWDKIQEKKFTKEEPDDATKETHIGLKRMYGLENLHFFVVKKGINKEYHCKYIRDPNDFDIKDAMPNDDLIFLLTAFSVQQGRVYFEDYGDWCVGLDRLKELYLPIRLAGI